MTEAVAKVVEKGNIISFDQSSLNSAENVVTIQWQQDLQDKKAEFIVIDAVLAEVNTIVPLFVQKALVENFAKKCQTTDDKSTVTVDGDFQYGQNKEKTMRFLVYHSKSNKPYQHLFINTTTAAKIATFARKISGNINLGLLKKLSSPRDRDETKIISVVHAC